MFIVLVQIYVSTVYNFRPPCSSARSLILFPCFDPKEWGTKKFVQEQGFEPRTSQCRAVFLTCWPRAFSFCHFDFICFVVICFLGKACHSDFVLFTQIKIKRIKPNRITLTTFLLQTIVRSVFFYLVIKWNKHTLLKYSGRRRRCPWCCCCCCCCYFWVFLIVAFVIVVFVIVVVNW
jgi:hypothetical protein